MFLLAAISVVACGWALLRYYTRSHPPMVVPATTTILDAGNDDADKIEIDLEKQQ
jgi:hypothetical protein